MAIITLTTDHGNRDFYIPAVKGYIYSQLPNVSVVDISHNIRPFNIIEAAFILRNCYQNFPPRTIHLVSVETDFETNDDYLLVQYKGQYIIAKDNGVISLIIDGPPDKLIKLHEKPKSEHLFPLKTILANNACKLAKNTSEYDLGKQFKDMKSITSLSPLLEKEVIRGTIIYIDNYGNAITNISKSHIERYEDLGKPSIFFSRRHTIDKISELYSDVKEGELVCLFGQTGLLEIAINRGSAQKLMDLRVKSKVLVEFE